MRLAGRVLNVVSHGNDYSRTVETSIAGHAVKKHKPLRSASPTPESRSGRT